MVGDRAEVTLGAAGGRGELRQPGVDRPGASLDQPVGEQPEGLSGVELEAPERALAGAAEAERRATRRVDVAGAGEQRGQVAGAGQLALGQTLWLFTDGLIESRRRPLDAGLAELANAAGGATGSLDEIADRLLVELPAQRDDDIALLGLRRVGEVL